MTDCQTSSANCTCDACLDAQVLRHYCDDGCEICYSYDYEYDCEQREIAAGQARDEERGELVLDMMIERYELTPLGHAVLNARDTLAQLGI